MKNFKVKNLNEGFLETSILDDLNKKWEDKFRYLYDENQNCYFLISKEKKFQIRFEGFKLDNFEVFKKMSNKNKLTTKEITYLSYNSQTPIQIKITKKSKIFLQNKQIQLNDLIILKEEQIDIKDGLLIFHPYEMDETIYFSIGTKNEIKQLKFNRVPIQSLNKIQYNLDPEEIGNKINLKIIIDIISEKMQFNYDVNSSNIQSCKEYFDFMNMFSSVLSEGIYFQGKLLKLDYNEELLVERRKLAELWEKIVELENFFDKEFIFRPNLSETEINDIYILYTCFIEGKPIRKNENPQYLTYNLSLDENKNSLNQYINNKFGLGIYGEFKSEILSINIAVPYVKLYFDLLVKDIEEIDEKKYKLILDQKNEGYSCIMLFKTKEEQKNFLESEDAVNNLNKIAQEICI